MTRSIFNSSIGYGVYGDNQTFKVAVVQTADATAFPKTNNLDRWWVQSAAGEVIPNWASSPQPNVGDIYQLSQTQLQALADGGQAPSPPTPASTTGQDVATGLQIAAGATAATAPLLAALLGRGKQPVSASGQPIILQQPQSNTGIIIAAVAGVVVLLLVVVMMQKKK